MKDKQWYKSKEIWIGAVIIIAAVSKKFGIDIPTEYLFGLLGLDITIARLRQGNAVKQ